jgi:hypothetical protein
MKTMDIVVCVCCLCRIAQPAAFQLSGDVYEVLYGSSLDDMAKTGSFGPVPFDTGRPQALRTVVEKFVEIARKTTTPGRPELTFTLADAQDKGVQSFVMYSMSGGGKGARNQTIEQIKTQTLDPSRVYPLLPLLPGYTCSLANLGFRNGAWNFRDDRDQNPVPGFRCSPKLEPTGGESWTVRVVVDDIGGLANRDREAVAQLPESIYDAMAALKSKYPILRTSRDDDVAEKEFLARIPPGAQVGYARRLDFVIKLRLVR